MHLIRRAGALLSSDVERSHEKQITPTTSGRKR